MSFTTWLYTKIYGKRVGVDEFGNVYYSSNRKKPSGREERWVFYNGEAEASKVPAEWHAWLHYTTDKPISAPKEEWQQSHEPNLTGTVSAYSPDKYHGNLDHHEESKNNDYEAWKPNE
tara:strand:+ start:956 stop:1309 length:354 start_codon:yes stop_codon:yes gene_type:complete